MPFTVGSQLLSGPSSEFRRDVRAAPRHVHSAHVVAHLLEQVKLGATNVNALQYGVSVYTVEDDVPAVDVRWRGHEGWGDALYAGLLGLDPKRGGYPWPIPALEVLPASVGTLRGVPIPDGARPAVGSDGALVVHKPSTGQLWELWQAQQVGGVWSAAWGGYVPDLRTSDGRHAGSLGVCASGLLAASGAIRVSEARAGRIEHAIGLALPHVVGARWSYPASRCDRIGSTSTAPFAIFEGQRFVLDPAVDVTTLQTSPDWRGRTYPVHPLCRAIATAAQTYGFVVADQTGSVVVLAAEEGVATMHEQQVAGRTPVNPWGVILGSARTWNVLDGFPWERLQALPHDYGKR
jgi:hypothetical protein